MRRGGDTEASNLFPLWALTKPLLSRFQEPDYGALYEGRNPGFYVEANPMPTFKVQPRALGAGSWGASPAAWGLHSLLRATCGLWGEVVLWSSEAREGVRGVRLVYDHVSPGADPSPALFLGVRTAPFQTTPWVTPVFSLGAVGWGWGTLARRRCSLPLPPSPYGALSGLFSKG